ncbi:hypothetical protein QJS10_CPB14g00485 [Acorus calamus]|uniref:linoleate 13S-lipoxygenase n=1 Tax=Acorus calamus TaxID=4465 RepID=A0AAV9DA82_ACOCL|nr:hypothetical protein QJS10_CPB14g00485 [Acorus calamus]
MLKSQLQSVAQPPLLFTSNSSTFATGGPSLLPKRVLPPPATTDLHRKALSTRRSLVVSNSLFSNITQTITKTDVVKAVVKVQPSIKGLLNSLKLSGRLDDLNDFLGQSIYVELVSAELDTATGTEKKKVTGYLQRDLLVNLNDLKDNVMTYEGELKLYKGFGEIGAILVNNQHHREMFIKTVVLSVNGDKVTFTCNSWVHANSDSKEQRVFFADKPGYLPSQTPSGLKNLRTKELEILRGDGTGERKDYERIYDYDVYNDLGNPDQKEDLARPVLGGKEHPYPRRCRTGRSHTKSDPLSESRTASNIYVPRDEAFTEVKFIDFSLDTVKSVIPAVFPGLKSLLTSKFSSYAEINRLYNDDPTKDTDFVDRILNIVKSINIEPFFFDQPELIRRDKHRWDTDEEFARQTLAGLNPYSIQLVTEFPLTSKLDSNTYGPPESAITKEILEQGMKGTMTVEEALNNKKLFMLDFHDLLLPYVHKVRQLSGTTLYGSRTVFFLTNDGTLSPLAIELTRPASSTESQWKGVFTPSEDENSTDAFLWKLAKAHVTAHDSGVHELISHWLRTHGCVEPYIIATNRQLSVLHPVNKLLKRHFRYTMAINALARGSLINAGGIIESNFSPGKYCIELSSVYYDQFWRFDTEALPADLIRRGMAVEDPTAKHGIKLTVEDYPFANDGLLIWSAIEQWVTEYVGHFYPTIEQVLTDHELQSWWTDIKTQGHADKKDESWWPTLDSPDNLVSVLTTIIWVTSCHHAAVNFGQYAYGGYFPNRPSIARTKMPTEEGMDAAALEKLKEKPESAFMECYPSPLQAVEVIAVLAVLSHHNVDEQYLGEAGDPGWETEKEIEAAARRFSERLEEIGAIVDGRNVDVKRKNRTGDGVVPYELLKPKSEPGITGMGVPNSISI